jgi:hypothetical protein
VIPVPKPASCSLRFNSQPALRKVAIQFATCKLRFQSQNLHPAGCDLIRNLQVAIPVPKACNLQVAIHFPEHRILILINKLSCFLLILILMVFIDFFNTPLIDLKINKILIFFSKNIDFYIEFFLVIFLHF